MIGDALTDVPAGKAVGARTVLMLTGVTTREAMADALPPRRAPDPHRRGRRRPRRILDELAGEAEAGAPAAAS